MSSLSIAILGLSITSSWGNGHATTYRSLVRALSRRGHRVLFFERDVPWYAENRDLPRPPFGRTVLYRGLDELRSGFSREIAAADLVIVGSFVPEGIAASEWVLETAQGNTAFYDIDTPVTLAGMATGEIQYLSPELIPKFDLYLSFTGGPTLARLEDEYGATMVRPLYCAADPAAYAPSPVRTRWDLGYLGTYCEDRQPGLAELLHRPSRILPEGRFVIAGPGYPHTDDWRGNLEWLPHVSPADHCAFYNGQRFTLNVTRADMVQAGWSPSVRLFEAAACGTPVISDWWDGLDTFFRPDEEILISRSAEQTVDYLLDISEDRRRHIGEMARLKILEAHTAAHRVSELEQHLSTLRRRPRLMSRERKNSWKRGEEMTSIRFLETDSAKAPADPPGHRVLVTGGAGFIGSHLCRWLLNEQHEVWCLDDFSTGSRDNIAPLLGNPRFHVIEHDIIQPLPGDIEVDQIYNLACPASPVHSQQDPVRTTKIIVLGALHMLELARKLRAPILQASTSEVYGDSEVHPQSEFYRGNVNQIGSRACYDEGKRCAESLFFDFRRQYQQPIKVCRIFNTYGPRMHPNDGRVVSSFLLQAIQNRPITVFGRGLQTRSFCYIDDLVDALIRLMRTPASFAGPVNLGNPTECTIMELVALIREVTGSDSPVTFRDLPEDDPRLRRPDIDLARRVLDWEPQTQLRDGLRRTADFFRELVHSRDERAQTNPNAGSTAADEATAPLLLSNGL